MPTRLSKSQFKPKVLEHLRRVQELGEELIITDRGRPVARVIPYEEDFASALASFRGTVVRFDEPTEPIAVETWEAVE